MDVSDVVLQFGRGKNPVGYFKTIIVLGRASQNDSRLAAMLLHELVGRTSRCVESKHRRGHCSHPRGNTFWRDFYREVAHDDPAIVALRSGLVTEIPVLWKPIIRTRK